MADTNKESLVQKLTNIADGFRTSRSLTSTLSLGEMAELAAVPVGGGENKLISYFSNDEMLELTEEDLADITELRDYAFTHAYLKSISLPSHITHMTSHLFLGTRIDTIKHYGTYFEDYCFSLGGNSSIITSDIYFLADNFSNFSNNIFQTGISLNLHFNNANSFNNAFSLMTTSTVNGRGIWCIYYQDTLITDLEMSSNITYIYQNAFRSWQGNKIKFLGDITKIDNYAFYGSTLTELDFTACTSVPVLGGTNAIGRTIVVKVPSALYNDWIVATNWSAVKSNIVAV